MQGWQKEDIFVFSWNVEYQGSVITIEAKNAGVYTRYAFSNKELIL